MIALKLENRRVHIAGSAHEDTSPELLTYAHELIALLTFRLAAEGATFVVGVGREPKTPASRGAIPIIFDWTVLESLRESIASGAFAISVDQVPLITTIATSETDRQIASDRRDIWDSLLASGLVQLLGSEMGWSSGAMRRISLADQGDILVIMSGGEGVEHLAQEYSFAGKPVIPLDLDIGSSSHDGNGGAARLATRMRSHPERFVVLDDPTATGALLAQMATRGGKTEVSQVVDALLQLLHAATPPGAFYIRLLNDKLEQYPVVERFFRNVVDPFIEHLGLRPIEMGRSESRQALIHEEIFSQLHNSPIVVADLTGLRPDCLIELGYAFGRNRKVILTALEGTRLTFDTSPIDCHFWSESEDDERRLVELKEHWNRIRLRAPLFQPSGAM